MPTRQRRIELLHRLQRLREVEKLRAAQQAAAAQGTHAKLLALVQRSAGIADDLASRVETADGGELARRLRFASGLEAIRHQTSDEARQAAVLARDAAARWREAEHRHELVGDRITAQRRLVETTDFSRDSALLARKLKGTP